MSKKVSKNQKKNSKKISKSLTKKKAVFSLPATKKQKGGKAKNTTPARDEQLTMGFPGMKVGKPERKDSSQRRSSAIPIRGTDTGSRKINLPTTNIPKDKYKQFNEAHLINASNDVIVKSLVGDLVRVYSMCLQRITKLKDRKAELREHFNEYYDIHLEKIRQEYSIILLSVPVSKKKADEKITHLQARVDEIRKYKLDRIQYLYQEFDRKDFFSLKTLNRWTPDEEMYMLEYGVKHVLFDLQNEIQRKIIGIEVSEKDKTRCSTPMINATDELIDRLADGLVNKSLFDTTAEHLANVFKGGSTNYTIKYNKLPSQFCYLIASLINHQKITDDYMLKINKNLVRQYKFKKDVDPDTFGSYLSKARDKILDNKYAIWMNDINDVLESCFPNIKLVKPKQ